ncbi:iron complex transport system permease protein [Evansella vedderi]|uniref:Iron complex transport system permease protein n=1 Tax=Evansella vedderi TaxID=38282 RepID=A0ABU0A2F8_9BACI|nr:iron ABC transporter permease [Evansella vedderi]MDQ0257289.1 iron complex transport system permease protein [Evansella vedderi]
MISDREKKTSVQTELTDPIKPYKKVYSKILFILGILIITLFCVMVLASSIGPVSIPFNHTIAIALDFFKFNTGVEYIQRDYIVITEIRLPRVIVGALVGAALGISGAIMQGLFRNPLVEPGYIGVSSGAAVGAVIALFFGWTQISKWFLPGAAFLGALLSILTILFIWQLSRKSSVSTLLLVGLGINLFLSAIISVFIASAPSEQELRSIVFWLQGGFEARTWHHVQLISPFILGAILIAAFFARELNMMLLGDEQAKSSGVNVRKTRYILLGLAALMTGIGVSVSGTIGFVGLVVPHVIRLLFGPDHRILLPASALGGAAFLVLADLVSRMVLHPVVLQVGVVCALVGAPIFLFLILKSRRGSI